VGRADAAGGEDVGVAGAQRVDRGDDLVLLVGNDAHLLQVDADRRHDVGEMADVAVLGPAGENLVADHHHRRRHNVSHRHPPSAVFACDISLPPRRGNGKRSGAGCGCLGAKGG